MVPRVGPGCDKKYFVTLVLLRQFQSCLASTWGRPTQDLALQLKRDRRQRRQMNED